MSTRSEPILSTQQSMAQTDTSHRRQERWNIAGVYLFLVIFSIVILIPFIWPFLSAFTHKPENVSSLYLYWPVSFTWDHFWNAIVGRGQALILLRNSIVAVSSAVLLALLFCSMGGYALSQARFRDRSCLAS